MKARRIGLRLALVALGLVAADLAGNRLFLADGRLFGRPVAPFDPPLFSGSQRQALARLEQKIRDGKGAESKFDPELGWCNRPDSGFGEFRYDWAGARIGEAELPRQKAPGIRRLVAIGCSMTHGEEVGAREAWCARLDAALPGWEVANLGVAAYGIDQALLRLRRDGFALLPDEVWLGILPAAALRVTTRFRPLLDHWSLDVAFKPRFVLDAQGELRLDPSPARVVEDVPRLLRDQRAFLEAMGDDTWLERSPLAYAPWGSSWTQCSGLTRVLLTVLERGGRRIPDCFDSQREFGRLFTTIVRTTAKECAERGVVFRVVLLPGKDDLEGRRAAGQGYWEEWARTRQGEGIGVMDLSEALTGSGLGFAQLFAPEGHYNAEASALVARVLASGLAP